TSGQLKLLIDICDIEGVSEQVRDAVAAHFLAEFSKITKSLSDESSITPESRGFSDGRLTIDHGAENPAELNQAIIGMAESVFGKAVLPDHGGASVCTPIAMNEGQGVERAPPPVMKT
ncbi:MAG: hypothetical protein AAFY09_14120, partial [Pseudomonadota bacterium]